MSLRTRRIPPPMSPPLALPTPPDYVHYSGAVGAAAYAGQRARLKILAENGDLVVLQTHLNALNTLIGVFSGFLSSVPSAVTQHEDLSQAKYELVIHALNSVKISAIDALKVLDHDKKIDDSPDMAQNDVSAAGAKAITAQAKRNKYAQALYREAGSLITYERHVDQLRKVLETLKRCGDAVHSVLGNFFGADACANVENYWQQTAARLVEACTTLQTKKKIVIVI